MPDLRTRRSKPELVIGTSDMPPASDAGSIPNSPEEFLETVVSYYDGEARYSTMPGVVLRNHLRILLRLLAISTLVAMLNRSNFVATLLSALLWAIVPGIFFGAIYLQVDEIAGWKWQEVLILLASYTVIDSVMIGIMAQNMQNLEGDIRTGGLDLTLSKPVDSQFYVSFRRIAFPYMVNAIPAAVAIVVGVEALGSSISMLDAFTYFIFMLCGMAVYYSVWFTWTTGAFWWLNIDGRHEMFLGIVTIARFPEEIYGGMAKAVFKFIVPVIVIANPAAKELIGEQSTLSGVLAILVTLLALSITRGVWNLGLRSYRSASS